MIRAGRRHLVRTLADIAAQQGIALQTLLNTRQHQADGFPAPLNAGRTRLYDGEQIDAFLAGRLLPPLPARDDEEDLLDRQEAAALRGVEPYQWDTRKKDPAVAEHLALVHGVEHWPRHVVRDHTPTPRRHGAGGGGGGRPTGAGDQVPRDQLLARVAQLLDDDPELTAAGVTDQLGVHRNTAQSALTQLRADRMADRMQQRGLNAAQAATELGYSPGLTRRAAVRAEAVLRGRQALPYLADVAKALHARGWTTSEAAPVVQHPDNVCVAAVTLDAPAAPAPALVWSELHGWRTATSRRHPLGRGAPWPPPGGGVRHLATGTTPAPDTLLQALTTTN
ncbi:DUF6292 family protein [Streptomyces fuscigenes]|uniref:DUF6292 family protein n=1 Tax=Streptomyces fuscigenes TaxID=1528880 RepID=UPI001F24E9AD|nr:DUF6292 family protein [Streptomyces fuscigenes]MCF3960492.1 DUF6292 family protein [Streptomyces fuscigenes]